MNSLFIFFFVSSWLGGGGGGGGGQVREARPPRREGDLKPQNFGGHHDEICGHRPTQPRRGPDSVQSNIESEWARVKGQGA